MENFIFCHWLLVYRTPPGDGFEAQIVTLNNIIATLLSVAKGNQSEIGGFCSGFSFDKYNLVLLCVRKNKFFLCNVL